MRVEFGLAAAGCRAGPILSRIQSEAASAGLASGKAAAAAASSVFIAAAPHMQKKYNIVLNTNVAFSIKIMFTYFDTGQVIVPEDHRNHAFSANPHLSCP